MKLGLYNVKATQVIPMTGPTGLAHALRNVYNFGIEDEKKSMNISIEEYEEQDDNNDCSN